MEVFADVVEVGRAISGRGVSTEYFLFLAGGRWRVNLGSE